MPSKYFSKPKLLHSLAGFFLNQGQNSVLANAALFISKKSFSILNNSMRPFHMTDFRPAFSLTGSLPQSNTMFACSAISGSTELLSACQLEGLDWKSGQMLNPLTSSVDYCMQASRSLKSQDLWGNNLVYKCLMSNSMGTYSKSNTFMDMWRRDFHTSRSATYSTGAAPDVSIDGALREEQIGDSTASSDQKLPGDRTLKLLSGSCYLPHPDKEETGGEDAHFICADEHDAVGVADGVGGWADLGVDAGQYARELMSHSVTAIQEEPKGSIDPARVLEKAYTSTKAKGSSTACIIALTNQGIHAVNLGDSGFIIVREGCTILRSPVQQHDFNFTYQLESGNGCDLPSAAQAFAVPVAAGDVIIAGTDGLFDNLYNNEVTAVVVHAVRAGFGPHVTAQKIAALARQRALDKERQTPFSTAAQDAGYRYHGEFQITMSGAALSDLKVLPMLRLEKRSDNSTKAALIFIFIGVLEQFCCGMTAFSLVSIFVKACKDQIDILKNRIYDKEKIGNSNRWLPILDDSSRADVIAHKHGMVLILSEWLHSVTAQFDRLRSIRFQDAVNRAKPRRKMHKVSVAKSLEASKPDVADFGEQEPASSSGPVRVQDQLLDDETRALQNEMESA